MLDSSIWFASIFYIVGFVCWFGAYRRWDWLIDPPEALWFCYSQSLIKSIFGIAFLRGFTFFLGAIFVVSATYILFEIA